MKWFDPVGLAIIAVIMVPNVVFAIKHKDGFENKYNNKTLELFEQISRFSCFILTIVSPPFLRFGFWFEGGQVAYIALSATLVALYCLFWVIFRKESSVRKSLALSITPSLVFIESGVLNLNVLLIVAAVVFSYCHVMLSYKNAELTEKEEREKNNF